MAEENVFEDFAKTIQSAGVRMGANFDKLGKGLDALNQKVDKILEMLGISLEDKVTDYQEVPSSDGILRSVDAPNKPMVEPMKLEDASVGKCLSLKQIEARNKIFIPPPEIVGKLEPTKYAEIEAVDCELFGEDANRDHADTNPIGEPRFEGHERVRYTRDQLLLLRDHILDLKQEVEAELFDEDPNQDRADTNVQGQSQTHYSEADTDDWRCKLAQLSAPLEGELYSTQKANEYNAQEQRSSQFAGTQMSPNQAVVNISSNIFTIKQEEPKLFDVDADRGHAYTGITGDSCFEGCECFRYSRDQLLKLRKVVNISDDILEIKQEFPLLFGENAHRGCADSNAQVQSQTLFSEPQFARTPVSLNPGQGPAPALIEAELASSAARRSNLSDDYCVLKTVMGILNNPTLKRFGLLKSQSIITGITSADILKGVVTLIFDKAVLEPTFCPKYARLFFDLNKKLPPFPSDESGRRGITCRCVLVNNCQETFEGAVNLQEEARQMTAPGQELERKDKEKLIKLRTLGNIRLIGEIFKYRMVTKNIIHTIIKELLIYNHKCCLAEENVEASCQLLINIGKLLDKSQDSRDKLDVYFDCLKKLSTNPQLTPRLRVMVCDVLDLRANNWVPKPILVL